MTKRPTKILVVDGDGAALRAIEQILTREGHEVVAIGDPTAGLAASGDLSVEVALIDIGLPNPSGSTVAASIQRARPDLEVIVLTARARLAAAVEAVKAGAYGYLIKPFENADELGLTVSKAIERKALRDRMRLLEARLAVGGNVEDSLGELDSSQLAALPYAQAKRMAIRGFERRYLTALLERTKFNVSSAARAAGVDRSNFRRLLKRYEIARATPGGEEAA